MSKPINVLAATFVFNRLSPEEGYDAFDTDEDGKVCLHDLRASVSQLQIGISDGDVRALFSSLENPMDRGFIDKKAWVRAINGAETADILKLRGVSTGPFAENVQTAINTIAATLVYNQLSPEDFYDAFDEDDDGKLSLSDLLSAVTVLGISEKDCRSVFASLDAGKTGFIPKAAWVEAIAGASAEDALRERGLTIPDTTAESKLKMETVKAKQTAINTIAAILVYNELSPEDGYDAFDEDDDGKLSLSDLLSAVRDQGISEKDCKSVFESLDAGKTGFIPKAAWVEVIAGASAEDVLRKRGLTIPDTTAEAKLKREPEKAKQTAINTIAAALVYNSLSPEDGYDAFDVDDDGKLSLSDLLSAVTQLKLEISEGDCKSVFENLDAGKTGFIPKAAWVEVIAGANVEDILKLRGVTITDTTAEEAKLKTKSKSKREAEEAIRMEKDERKQEEQKRKREEALRKLAEMGFSDKSRNEVLLEQTHNDVAAVVDRLTQDALHTAIGLF